MDAALRAMGSPTPPRGCLGHRPEGVHAPATGETIAKFGDWLTRNHVPKEADGRLSPAAHTEKRELYLRLLSEARQGTREQFIGDCNRYLAWEPGPHWGKGVWRRLLGEQEACNYRASVTDNLGRV